jgi:hypothetical protein
LSCKPSFSSGKLKRSFPLLVYYITYIRVISQIYNIYCINWHIYYIINFCDILIEFVYYVEYAMCAKYF